MTAAAVAMWPSGLAWRDLSLALARGLFVAGVLSSFGAALFLRLFAPLARRRSKQNVERSYGLACFAPERQALPGW